MSFTASKGLSRTISGLLGLALFITAGLAGLYFTVMQPTTTKAIIAKSGAYNSMSNAAINAVVAQKSTTSLLPLDSPDIKQILGAVFTPADLQKTTEGFIDRTYLWLDGKTTELPLALNVTDSKQQFISKTGEYLQNRLAGLPVCTTRAQIANNTDPFVSTCVPPNTDVVAQRKAIEEQLTANSNIPSELSIDGATTGKIDNAKSVLDGASKIPEQYQRLKRMFFIGLAVCVALAMVIIFVSADFVAGLGTLGRSLLKTGGFILFFGFVSWFVLPHMINGVDLKISQAADTVILPLLKSFVLAFSKVYLLFGVCVSALGAIALGIEKYAKR